MRRMAARVRPPGRQQVAEMQSTLSPVNGWNARDPLANMKVGDAVTLENWYPRVSDCIVRGGSDDHVTGIASRVKALMVYSPLSGIDVLFAATNTNVYNVSAAGAVGASVAAVSPGTIHHLNFGDGGTQYLILVNGVDKPWYYNGTTWLAVDSGTSPALSGVASTTLSYINVFKERLFFIQKNTLSFWYLAAGSVGGALTEFPMESYFHLGGNLVAMATWTIDGGAGVDDLAVFITNQGEVAVFQGTSPQSLNTWSLVGIYKVGTPIGSRCFVKVAGDIVLITESGILPLSKALQSSAVDRTVALSDRIADAFLTAAKSYSGYPGWEALVYPAENALLVNIPITDGNVSHQYVMNLTTKAWTKFIGWNAECWAVFNNDLYFGGNTAVVKAWTGTDDNGTDIVVYGKSAFTDLKKPGVLKRVVGIRPKLISQEDSVTFQVGLDVDYSDRLFSGTVSFVSGGGSQWNVGQWGTAVWGSTGEIVQEWESPPAYEGHVFSGKLKIALMGDSVRWVATDYLYMTGAVI